MKTNSRIEYELTEEGLDINVHRFPYAYHHDFVRQGMSSKSDIAQRLRSACKDLNEYDYSACYGAILYLISEQPEKITEGIVGILEHTRAGSFYNVDGTCGQNRMRELLGV